MSSTETRVTPIDAGPMPYRARLDGPRAQIAFSLLLDTLARPGTVRNLSRVGLAPGLAAPLALPLALADVETSVAVIDADPDHPWSSLIVDATGAPLAAHVDAAQVVLLSGFGAHHISELRRGTRSEPEDGARVAIACRRLHSDDASHAGSGGAQVSDVVLELSGPGIDGTRRLGIDGLAVEIFDAIAEANRHFPAGIDCWFVTPFGDIAAISRSTDLRVLRSAPSTDEIEEAD